MTDPDVLDSAILDVSHDIKVLLHLTGAVLTELPDCLNINSQKFP